MLNHVLCGRITSCPSFNLALYPQCHQPNCKVRNSFVFGSECTMSFSETVLHFSKSTVLHILSKLTEKWHCVYANYLLIHNLPLCSHTVLMHPFIHPLLQGFLYLLFCWPFSDILFYSVTFTCKLVEWRCGGQPMIMHSMVQIPKPLLTYFVGSLDCQIPIWYAGTERNKATTPGHHQYLDAL